MLDAVLLDTRPEVQLRAEHGQRGGLAVVDQRVLVEEADRAQAELGCSASRRATSRRPGRRRRSASASRPRPAAGSAAPVESDPSGGQVEGAEGPEADRLAGELVDVPGQEDAEGDEGHAGEEVAVRTDLMSSRTWRRTQEYMRRVWRARRTSAL